jgi:hypothetical protein
MAPLDDEVALYLRRSPLTRETPLSFLRGMMLDERAAPHLADYCLGQLVAEFDLGWDLVRRELRLTMPADVIGRCRRAGMQYYPGFDGLAFARVWHASDADLSDRRVQGDDLFDLTRPDLVATRLDQVFLAFDQKDIAIVVHPAKIAGVQPAAT